MYVIDAGRASKGNGSSKTSRSCSAATISLPDLPANYQYQDSTAAGLETAMRVGKASALQAAIHVAVRRMATAPVGAEDLSQVWHKEYEGFICMCFCVGLGILSNAHARVAMILVKLLLPRRCPMHAIGPPLDSGSYCMGIHAYAGHSAAPSQC